MKKALTNTRVSVKLRKSEYREEWYLYVEAYLVVQADKPTLQRVHEYLNRTITTPIWDKSRNPRTDKDGKKTRGCQNTQNHFKIFFLLLPSILLFCITFVLAQLNETI